MRYNKIVSIFACAVLALASCVNESEALRVESPSQGEAYAAGELFVKFTPEVAALVEASGVVRSDATRSGVTSVDELLNMIGGFELSRVFPVDPRHEERTVRDGLNCWYLVRYSNDYSADDVARCFSALGEVQKTDINRTIKRANTRKAMPLTEGSVQSATRALQGKFNDPLYSLMARWLNLVARRRLVPMFRLSRLGSAARAMSLLLLRCLMRVSIGSTPI